MKNLLQDALNVMSAIDVRILRPEDAVAVTRIKAEIEAELTPVSKPAAKKPAAKKAAKKKKVVKKK